MTDEKSTADEGSELELAHILLLDVVGYSRLLVNEQIEVLQQLNKIVRATPHFRRAEAANRLTRLPTGDGMALLFFSSPEEPAHCALEISAALKSEPQIQLRMGAHSGAVNRVLDVNDQVNIAGQGINLAQRVMDCGDAGHILLSRHIADYLAQYREWQPYLHDLGECTVKHNLRLHIVNLCKNDLGNPNRPTKLRRTRRWKAGAAPERRPSFYILLPLLGLFLVGALLAGGWWLGHQVRHHPLAAAALSSIQSSAAAIPEKSIAVLPFENLSNNQDNIYFTDGVQNEIVTDLAKVADLKVISRTSVMQFRDASNRNVREIAKELGVAHILEGTVQRVGDTVRVTAQLIDARTDSHIWGNSYDRAVSDVFAIETDLAQKIVSQLKATLSVEEEAAIKEKPTQDLEAYSLYLRGRDHINAVAFGPRGQENLTDAIRLLEEAVKRDPTFAGAYYQLARAHDILYFLGYDHTATRLAMANSAIQALIRLQPNSGEAHLAQAQHYYWGYRDYARARAELVQAQRLLPNEPLVLLLRGYIDRREGRWDESIAAMERALSLDPRNTFILQQACLTYDNLRRYSDEVAALDKVLAITPNDVSTRVQRATVELNRRADLEPLRKVIAEVTKEGPRAMADAALAWQTLAQVTRDPEIARDALANMPATGLDSGGILIPKPWWAARQARARGDDRAAKDAFREARPAIEKITQEQPDNALPWSYLGIIDAGLGNKEDAIREGKRAVELLPISKDALVAPDLMENLALIYAWVGEKELACDELENLVRIPSAVSYGNLRLGPDWDSLRGDPRFEKIVAFLAPK